MTLGLATGQVLLSESHAAWAEEFRLERERILQSIGAHILDIHHVGSTAVPGVPAKPVLDILVGVENYERASVCVPSVKTLGYQYRGEYGIARRHYFVKGDPRTHHLHIVEKTSVDWVITLRFRDFLLADLDAAIEYANAKRHLAEKYAQDRVAYQQEKDRIVERLLKRADDSEKPQ